VVTTEVDAGDQLEAKVAAMRRTRRRSPWTGPFFALSNNIGQRAFGIEHYTLGARRARPRAAGRTTGRTTCSPGLPA
jgi:N-acetyl-1-D-myo-inositol-2-amino-2-deoxy-alpha-D-glucopyranoside deacetylase